MKFLLDANFLMIPWMFKLDIFDLLKDFEKPEFYTLNLIIAELEKLSSGRGKKSIYAKMALHSLEKELVKIILVRKGNTDRAILNIAQRGFVVCTQDRKLIKRLKRKKCRIVTMKQKRYLREL